MTDVPARRDGRAAAACHRRDEDPQDTGNGEDFIRDVLDRYGDDLFRYARELCGRDYQRAEDLVQETLLRAWLKGGTVRAGGAFRAWLFAVARNLAKDEWRARGVRPAEVGLGPETPDLTRVDSSEDQILNCHVVAQALSGLKPAHLELIAEIYYRGSSFRGAARILGIPEGTGAKRVHDALRHLREDLGE